MEGIFNLLMKISFQVGGQKTVLMPKNLLFSGHGQSIVVQNPSGGYNLVTLNPQDALRMNHGSVITQAQPSVVQHTGSKFAENLTFFPSILFSFLFDLHFAHESVFCYARTF